MHVLGWGVVVLGVCWVKPAGEGVLGTLAGVSSKQPIWDRGQGCTPQCTPTVTFFGDQVLGFYLRMEDMSSPRSEIEWINMSIGLRTHHPAERGVRAELSSASAEPYLLRMDSGVSVGERWRLDHPLRATPVWPHGSISQFRYRPF
jgi:hypothetical protein